jgi:hypothetical protein
VARLIPRRTTRNATEVDAIVYLLGLSELPTAGPWPSQTEVAAAIGVTRGRVGQLVVDARERWRKTAAVTNLRDALSGHVEALGGIAAAPGLERAVLAERPVADSDRAQLFARAAVRAAVEVELAQDNARLAQPSHLRASQSALTFELLFVSDAGIDQPLQRALLPHYRR